MSGSAYKGGMRLSDLDRHRDEDHARLILRHLEAADWVMRRAAKTLDVSPSTLYSMLARLGLMDEYRQHQGAPDESQDQD